MPFTSVYPSPLPWFHRPYEDYSCQCFLALDGFEKRLCPLTRWHIPLSLSPYQGFPSAEKHRVTSFSLSEIDADHAFSGRVSWSSALEVPPPPSVRLYLQTRTGCGPASDSRSCKSSFDLKEGGRRPYTDTPERVCPRTCCTMQCLEPGSPHQEDGGVSTSCHGIEHGVAWHPTIPTRWY
jgi:hypothetical protein